MLSWLTYIVYSALWSLVRFLPENLAYRCFEILASIAYRRNGKRVQRLRVNYSYVKPEATEVELELMVRQGLASAM